MRLEHLLLLTVAGVAATLLAAACGGEERGDPVATTEVAMARSYRFEPAAVVVDAGATVTWTNEDNFTHTVRVDGRDDHEVEPGERMSIAFDEAGTYHYVCTLHRRDMDGEVIVR
jgi:plastocyanin